MYYPGDLKLYDQVANKFMIRGLGIYYQGTSNFKIEGLANL